MREVENHEVFAGAFDLRRTFNDPVVDITNRSSKLSSQFLSDVPLALLFLLAPGKSDASPRSTSDGEGRTRSNRVKSIAKMYRTSSRANGFPAQFAGPWEKGMKASLSVLNTRSSLPGLFPILSVAATVWLGGEDGVD